MGLGAESFQGTKASHSKKLS
ncbi:hypothetical protein VULLAG_LOCUS22964 [Vulpes lagopus]